MDVRGFGAQWDIGLFPESMRLACFVGVDSRVIEGLAVGIGMKAGGLCSLLALP